CGSMSEPHAFDWDPTRLLAHQESKHPDRGSVPVRGRFGDDNLWRAYPRSDAARVAKNKAEPRFRWPFSSPFQTGFAIPRKTKENPTLTYRRRSEHFQADTRSCFCSAAVDQGRRSRIP